jgi:hypothetical protein
VKQPNLLALKDIVAAKATNDNVRQVVHGDIRGLHLADLSSKDG